MQIVYTLVDDTATMYAEHPVKINFNIVECRENAYNNAILTAYCKKQTIAEVNRAINSWYYQ
jgi:hypothetical protein